MPKLSGVIFDADGVLQHAGPFASRDWVWTAQQHRDFIAGLYGGGLTPDALNDAPTFMAACARALGTAGWPQDAGTYLDRWRAEAVITDAAMVEDIRRLKAAGVACYLGSNQDAFWAQHLEDRLGPLFDDLFISCRMGAAKPQAAFFEAVLAAVPFPAEELVFFDDKAANVEAAQAAGLPARLFTDRATYLRDLQEMFG